MGDWSRLRALELIEELCENGFTVQADRHANRVWVGPSFRLTDDLRHRIRDHKPELLYALDPPRPDGPCADCGGVNFLRRPAGRWQCLNCWEIKAETAAEYFFGPLAWYRKEVPA